MIILYTKKRHNQISWYQISTISGTVSFSQNETPPFIKKKKIQNLSNNLKSTFWEKARKLKSENQNLVKSNIEKEIGKIKNQISYPELAAIQGWESSCEWEISIGEDGFAKSISVTKPCDYEIFENTFRKTIKKWKFDLPKDTILNIPIEFIIDRN